MTKSYKKLFFILCSNNISYGLGVLVFGKICHSIKKKLVQVRWVGLVDWGSGLVIAKKPLVSALKTINLFICIFFDHVNQ